MCKNKYTVRRARPTYSGGTNTTSATKKSGYGGTGNGRYVLPNGSVVSRREYMEFLREQYDH